MPFEDLSANHYTAEDKMLVRDLLVKIENILEPRFGNLNDEERGKYGSINEKNKLIVNKVRDYLQNERELCSTDVDWDEFELDYQDRVFLKATMLTMQRIITGMDNTRILHDYDNYRASLRDYDYAQYKNNGSDARFETKVKELKQFFSRSGTSVIPPDSNTDTTGNQPTDDLPVT
jgi:hypothetical protein